MATLTENLQTIYTVKNQIKEVIGTQSDLFSEYPTLISNAIEAGGSGIDWGDVATAGYIIPAGSINVNANGTVDVSSYANANVYVETDWTEVENYGYIIPSGTITIDDNEIGNNVDVSSYQYAYIDITGGGGGSSELYEYPFAGIFTIKDETSPIDSAGGLNLYGLETMAIFPNLGEAYPTYTDEYSTQVNMSYISITAEADGVALTTTNNYYAENGQENFGPNVPSSGIGQRLYIKVSTDIPSTAQYLQFRMYWNEHDGTDWQTPVDCGCVTFADKGSYAAIRLGESSAGYRGTGTFMLSCTPGDMGDPDQWTLWRSMDEVEVNNNNYGLGLYVNITSAINAAEQSPQ